MGSLFLLALAVIVLAIPSVTVGAAPASHAALLRAAARQTGTVDFFSRPGGEELLERSFDLTKRIDAAGGCGADVCFALDGSKSLSGDDFRSQQQFARLIAIVLSADSTVKFSAVQYGTVNVRISDVTNNADLFLSRIANTTFLRADRSFVSAGLLFCTAALGKDTGRRDRVALFGDGGANFGPDTSSVTDSFLPPNGNGSILAVGVGNENRTELARIAGRGGAVVSIVNQTALSDALQETVEFLCEL